jgi:alpha-L-rhamnosidase
LTVECADGTTHTLTTDGEWRAAASPVVENDVYDGEVYDARREREGWASPGFDDADWDQATVVAGPDGALAPQRTDPIRVVETLAPERVIEHRDGPIVDFGQNHTGWVELDVSGLDAGESVELRHAEALAAHGDLLTVDLRTARARDRYVASGDDETYAPRFTYHGYRYVQVSGLPGDLTAADVRSHVVHTDVEPTGEFACSNGDLERVQANARWGLRSNAHSVPTDCPQRDERQGFTGDGHLAAAALLYNFDAGRFHEKFVRDHADAQSPHGYLPSTMPSGGDPGITDPTWTYSWLHLPWQVYCHDATERPLREHYEGLRRYVDFWLDVESAGLVPETYSVYGDWVALEANEGSRGGPTRLFTDAYHYRGTALLADIAAAIGEDADAERYRERAAAVRDAFNERYFDADAGRYDPRTQAANAVPLALGLVPEGRASEVADALARKVCEEDDGGLRTGFLGTPALLAALTEHGHADLAYEVVSRPEFPGWVYQVEQGATTVWERWDTDEHVDSGMNSRNHSPFALVSAWFYEALAGVRVDERLPRDNVVGVAPRPVDALDWAAGSVETPHGTVAARWERGGDGLTLTVTVPWNLAAAVEVPVDPSGRVRVDGDLAWDDGPVATAPGPVRRASSDGDRPTLVLDPGDHEVAVESSDP